jgi:RNA polymerase sigma-70 factor (ECF subfamily)
MSTARTMNGGRAVNVFRRGGNEGGSSVKAVQSGARERFLVHGEALQRLARALDREDADDLVQDTWLRVLDRPAEAEDPRGWLRGVLRNVWRMDRRATRRRIERETWASLPTPCVDGPDVALAQAECRAQIGARLEALPERLRSVVRQRYFEGLSAVAIAQRERIPAGTVRRRLKEALDRLRAEPPEHLRGGVLVLALRDGGASKLVGWGVVAMKASTKAILAGVVATVGVVGAAMWHDDAGAIAPAPTTAPMLDAPRIDGDASRSSSDAAARERVAANTPSTPSDARAPRRARRDALLADIRAARESYRRSAAAAAEDAATPPDDGIDKDYLRERIAEDLIPSARGCYNDVLVVDPEAAGKIVLEFEIVADESLGGVVDMVEFGEDTSIADAGMLECMRDAMYDMTFDPPKSGGIVQVTYPFVFEPG